jgi:hypothetical protein
MKATATVNTVLKKQNKQSAELSPDELFDVRAGDTFDVKAIGLEGDHRLITFIKGYGPKEYNTWYIYAPHWRVTETRDSTPNDVAPASIKSLGIIIPGLGERQINDLIDGSKYFTWAEATRNGSRLWNTKATTDRVRGVASILDGIRSYYQRPIIITSWFRDPKTNKAVGGAPNSRHIVGDAVDFILPGVSTQEVYNMCNKSHVGGLAQSPGNFVHVDNRGYDARWVY